MIRKKLIYFDNSTNTFPKAANVYKKLAKFLEKCDANPNNVKYDMSLETSKMIYATREKLAKLFNIDNPLNIAFTKSSTESIGLLLDGYLKKGDHVITTVFASNSIMDKLYRLEGEGIQVSVVEADKNGEIDSTHIDWAIRENTKLIITNHSSCATGVLLPIKDIGVVAKKHSVAFAVDCTYSAGLYPLDVLDANISFLTFSTNRYLLGPQGLGGLYIKESITLEGDSYPQPQIMPDYLEQDSTNLLGITNLYYSLEHLEKLDRKKENKRLSDTFNYLFKELNELEGIELYTPKDSNINLILLKHKSIKSEDIREILDDKYNIALLDNKIPSNLLLNKLSIENSIRISLSYSNSIDEVKSFLKALNDIIKVHN